MSSGGVDRYLSRDMFYGSCGWTSDDRRFMSLSRLAAPTDTRCATAAIEATPADF
jgi:hypothetical protein